MPALHAEIFAASYRSTRSPFPDAKDVYILGAIDESTDLFIDANGPNDVPTDAANVVLLVIRPVHGAYFTPAVYLTGTTGDDGDDPSGWARHPDQFAFGGRYVGTSDSRFSTLIEKATGHRFYGAVPLHDYSMTRESRDNAYARAVHEEANA